MQQELTEIKGSLEMLHIETGALYKVLDYAQRYPDAFARQECEGCDKRKKRKIPDTFADLPGIIRSSKGKYEEIRKLLSKSCITLGELRVMVNNILVGELPSEINKECGEIVVNEDVTDDNFLKCLSEATKKKTKMDKLMVYGKIQKSLADSIQKLSHKEKKLSERISTDYNSVEGRVAIALRNKIRTAMSVLQKRSAIVSDRFYKIRKAIFEQLMFMSEEYAKLFPLGNDDAYQCSRKHKSNLDNECFQNVDLKLAKPRN